MKNISRFLFNGVLVIVFSLLTAVAMGFAPRVPVASAVEDCSSAKRYNCQYKRSEVETLISSWCSASKPDKRSECVLTILAESVETDPLKLAREGVGGVPSYCKLNAQVTDAQKSQIANCYTLIKRSSDWYDAIVKAESECGTPPNQDAACIYKAKQEFLYARGLAEKPKETITKGIDGGDAGMPASQTPFMLRVATYLRWTFLGIGVLAVFGFVISGIQYGVAQDNAQSVAAAKTRIINIIYGVVIFAVMFAMLQWLVPGGIF